MASERKYYWINDFSGGIRAGSSKANDNESADIQGMWTESGDLVAMRSSATLPAYAHDCNSLDEVVVQSHTDYITNKKLPYLIAKRERTVWAGIPLVDYDPPRTVEYASGYAAYMMSYIDCKEIKTDTGGNYVQDVTERKLRAYNVQRIPLWSDDVLRFDGRSSYCQCTSATASFYYMPEAPFGISVWVRSIGNNGKSQGVVSHYDGRGYYLSIDASGKLLMDVVDDLATKDRVASYGTTDLHDNEFHHVFAYYKHHSFPRLFLDGIEEAITSTLGTVGTLTYDSSANFYVGKSPGGFSLYGDIGQVGLYSALSPTLTSTGVKTIYDATKKRYGVSVQPTTAWYPLLADSYYLKTSGTIARNTQMRSQTSAESFAQAGSNLYMSPQYGSDTDYAYRWPGVVCRKGLIRYTTLVDSHGSYYAVATHAGGYTTDYTANHEWKNADVRAGDILFIKDYSNSRTGGEWKIRGAVIEGVSPSNDGLAVPIHYLHTYGTTTDTRGKGVDGIDAVPYAIVRVNRTGIKEGNSCYATLATIAGSLATGAYRYLWRYGNSKQAIYGNPSDPSNAVSVTGTHGCRVYRNTAQQAPGWELRPDDWGVDTLEIYRSKNAGVYNLATTINMVGLGSVATSAVYTMTKRLNLATKYVDTGWATGATLPLDAYAHARPDALRSVRVFNNRIYGLGANQNAHYLNFSSLGEHDYWPSELWDYQSTSSGTTYGGSVKVGANANDRITAIVPEGGAYDSLGVVGANILLFTESDAKRWSGWDWSDFRLDSAFSGGCQAPNTAVNAGGQIIWCGRDHILSVSAGGGMPVPIDLSIFPNGLRQLITQTSLRGMSETMRKWNACFWDNKYFLSVTPNGSYPSLTLVYDLLTQKWTSLPQGFHDLHSWQRPGWSGERIITGSSPTSTSYNGADWGDINHLFIGTTGYAWKWLSRPLYFESVPQFMKTLQRITLCFVAPEGANETVAVNVYTDGDAPPFYSNYSPTAIYQGTAQTITYNDSRTEIRRYVEVSPKIAGKLFQIQVSATGTRPVRLEWALCEYVTHSHAGPVV